MLTRSKKLGYLLFIISEQNLALVIIVCVFCYRSSSEKPHSSHTVGYAVIDHVKN